METEPIGAVGAVRFHAAEQARQLAVTRQTEILQDQGVTASTPNTPVISNPSFSPALYAQAAQFQLYTQSGVLASLAQQVHATPVQSPRHSEPDAIHAVEEGQGTSVDMRA